MKTLFGLKNLKRFKKPIVLAIGVFDGVHTGHKNILKATVNKAKKLKGTSVVLTFWPHPAKQQTIYSLKHRLSLIEELGVEVCIVVKFSKGFSKILPEDFARNILLKRIGADYIYVGKTFRFGKDAKGNFKALRILSELLSFRLKVFDVVKLNSKAVSSTLIRNLIKNGKLKVASKLLSRPVSVLGTVTRGSFLAGRLGFATANIDPHHEVTPPKGVYLVKVILDSNEFNGICYIGARPTIQRFRRIKTKQPALRIEVHIFNFKENIYGRTLNIQFIKRIREEKEFDSIPKLQKQVKIDIKAAKSLFSRH